MIISSLKKPETRDEIFFRQVSRDKTLSRNILSKTSSLESLGGIKEQSEPSSELSQVSLQVNKGLASSG